MGSNIKLAKDGGTPVRESLLPYAAQWLDEDDIEAVIDVLRSPYLTTGPKIKEFEDEFAKYSGAKYAVAVSNGTAALHAAMFAAGIGAGDEVITTPMTFAASANCVLYMGATPVFADIDPETYNIDLKEIERHITSRTRAIIPVHYTGQPCEMDEIHGVAKKHGLAVVEDAAHALGAEYKGRRVGGLSDMTTFSFHPVKHITSGEGGMITTNDSALYRQLVLFRTHGITRDAELMLRNDGPWYYEMNNLGYNSRLTDVQAALGKTQLAKIEQFLKLRKKYVDMYNEGFLDFAELIIPFQKAGTKSAWHLYVIQLRTEMLSVGRKEIFQALRAENIGVNVHYLPVYQHPYYTKLGYQRGLCPNAEELYNRIITLPLFPKMSEQDVNDVIKAVKKVINFYRNRTRG